MKKKLLSIILSIMVAVTFMPLGTGIAFAADGEGSDVNLEQPVAQFDSASKVDGIKVAGYTYNSVKLAWNEVDQADGYKIYRATKKKGKYKLIKTVTSTEFNDTGNKYLSKYRYYKIRAYGTVDGNTVLGAYSAIFRAKPAIPAVTGVKTSGGSGKVTISWNKLAGAKKYRVYRATSKDGKYSRVKITTGTSFTNTVTTGTRYYYKVRAYRGKRKGGYSTVVEGMANPAAPTGVTAVQEGNGISVSWTGVTAASSYEVYRSESAKGEYTYVGTSESTGFADTEGLENGKTYFYKVKALALVNGSTQAGAFSSNEGPNREAVINTARSYKGIKEKSTKHKDIVNTFNSEGNGKIGYGDPWCAAFVSAIEIKTGNSSLVPLYSYCPTMLDKFMSKTYNRSYKPRMADVVFFDWNKNDVPDHVGFVDNYNSSTGKVTTI
ncbi:MAG: hypothetical protein Q4D99_01770 [Bacillota bacterium]|nr:hypothetical protein [Bacillota bacterium]